MIITAYKSEYTGEIFEHEADYKKHVRREKSAAKKEAAHQASIDEWKKWLANEKAGITNHNMIQPWLMDNQRKIMDFHNMVRPKNSFGWDDDSFHDTDKFTEIVFNLKYSKLISNTHSCPEGGITNWWCKEDLPRGYPGFSGQISGTLSRDTKHNGKYPYDSFLKFVKIHVETGGGGNIGWEYSSKIFIAEWPGLQQEIDLMERDQIVNRLKGVR